MKKAGCTVLECLQIPSYWLLYTAYYLLFSVSRLVVGKDSPVLPCRV